MTTDEKKKGSIIITIIAWLNILTVTGTYKLFQQFASPDAQAIEKINSYWQTGFSIFLWQANALVGLISLPFWVTGGILILKRKELGRKILIYCWIVNLVWLVGLSTALLFRGGHLFAPVTHNWFVVQLIPILGTVFFIFYFNSHQVKEQFK